MSDLTDNVEEAFTAHDLAFRARALAQAHALSEAATRYRSWRIAQDEVQHPIPELTTWAATAFLTGYCVRRVEESRPACESAEHGNVGATTATAPTTTAFATWERDAVAFANAVPRDADTTLLAHRLVLDALDDVISREIDKRAEHVKEQVPAAQWDAFEDFIGWWVLHGYAVRAVEV